MTLFDTLNAGDFIQVSGGMGTYTLYWKENQTLCKLNWCSGWPPTNDKIKFILDQANKAAIIDKLTRVNGFNFNDQEPIDIIQY